MCKGRLCRFLSTTMDKTPFMAGCGKGGLPQGGMAGSMAYGMGGMGPMGNFWGAMPGLQGSWGSSPGAVF